MHLETTDAHEFECAANAERYGYPHSNYELLRSIASQAMRILEAAGMSGPMSDHARRWWHAQKEIEARMRGQLGQSVQPNDEC